MRSLENIKKSVMEIATLLAQDEVIIKLLLIDSADALSKPTPSTNINTLIKENYISIYPPVENRIEEYNRNTFISILIDNVYFTSFKDDSRSSIVIYASTNEDHILLENNKHRLLEICDRIVRLLNGYKLSSSGAINVNSMSHVMLSEFHSAYRISLSIADQQDQKAEI